MASKFVLDTGQLDTDYLTTPPTLILDSTNRGKLDTNVLSSGEPIVVNDVATSALGGMSATVQSTPIVQVTATSQLGTLSSSASVVVTKVALAQSLLGSLIATIQALPLVQVTAVSDMGGLVANADAVIPAPEQKYGKRNPYYQVKNKKKPESIEIEPTIIDYKFEPLDPLIKTIFATSQTELFGLGAMAQSRIDFSTEQDDLDLLTIL